MIDSKRKSGARPTGLVRARKIVRIRRIGKTMSRRKVLAGMAAMAGMLVPSSYAVAASPYRFEINIYDIPVANLPPAFDGFCIAQITDVHVGFNVTAEQLGEIVGRINALGVDAVALTGDYADHGRDNMDAAWGQLARLEARHGVHAVLGNHDHWIDGRGALDRLEASGHSVRHRSKAIEIGGDRIWIGGAGAMWNDDLGIDRAFDGLPEKDCRICLSHYPDAADENFRARVDLMLAGHTHGGQVDIPGLPKFWTRNAVRNPDYMAGFVQAPSTGLFVSRGIGCYVLPVRINCPPEVAILRLRPAMTLAAPLADLASAA